MPDKRNWLVGGTERWLIVVILAMVAGLGLCTDTFLTLSNVFDLMNTSAVNAQPSTTVLPVTI